MTHTLPDPKPQPPAQLQTLLDIVGAAEAPALLAQLHADLMDCDRLIADATPSCDWPAIRRASHNLTALAGTAGATPLQRMAEELNRIAHAEDRLAFADLAPGTRNELSVLSKLIRSLTMTKGRK